MTSTSYRTYDAWKQRGRYVRAGEKAAGWLAGASVALYHKDQTEKVSSKGSGKVSKKVSTPRPVDSGYRRPGPGLMEGARIAYSESELSTYQ